MKFMDYNIEFHRKANQELIWLSINNDRFECDSSKNTLDNILNCIKKYHEHKISSLQMGTYNKAVYWPIELELALEKVMSKRYQIEPTNHLFERLEQYNLPRGCYKALLYGEIIEAEVDEYHNVVKIVTRIPNRHYTDEDICSAIVIDKDKYFDVARVKTIWINMNYDTHKTINKSNYVTE